MEHLSIVLTNYIFKRDLLIKKLRNIPIWFSMLFRSFCQHNLQYCDCLVAAYVFRMPVFLPIVYSNAFIQRRLAFKNLFFLFYRLLLDTNYYPAYCEIPYYLDSYFLYAVRVLCHYNFNHRTCRSSKQGS